MRIAYWFTGLAVVLAACGSPSPLNDGGASGKDGGAGASGSGAAGSNAGTAGTAGTGAAGVGAAGMGAAGTGAAGTGSAGTSSADGGDAAAAAGADGGATDAVATPRETVHWGSKRDLDLLFMIDTSLSMKPLQQKLLTNFPGFMDVLKSLPSGLPNLHLAVVSSNLGAGAFDIADVPQCVHGGDQGRFQSMPKGTTCATGHLNAGQNFISNVGGQANYTGDISDVFSCIAALGDQGCGFEHQFGSVLRSLGADGAGPAPVENANFLRPNAVLAIVLVTNEDDCSAPINSTVFDPSSRFVSDTLGPLNSYRCNDFGHLCGGARPPRTMAADLTGTCKSAEDGILLKVSDVAARLKGLKADPSLVIVSAIAGPPAPYKVSLGQPTLQDDPAMMWPQVDHSCMAADGSYADPGIRIGEWVQAFGAKGSFHGICNDSFQPALNTIAQSVGTSVDLPCLDAKLFDTNTSTAGLQPDCAFVDHATNDMGVRIDSPLTACAANGNVAPCWTIAADARCGASGLVTFKRTAGAPADLTTTGACQLCGAGDTRSGCM